MDKYEYKLKLEQMKALTCEHDYKTAASIADTINWRKVRSVNSLCMVAEIYEHVNRMEDSRDMLLLAYDRSPIGKMIIYRLAMLAIRMNSLEEAEEYYQEFLDIAPHDSYKYVIRYRLHQAQDKDLSLQIQDLEDLKEQEYTEEWAYALAELYGRARMVEKCIKECDELILWFGDGPYVEKALKLKMRYQPLSHEQAEKLRKLQQLSDSTESRVIQEELRRSGQKEEDVDELTATPMKVTAARSLHIPFPGIEEEGIREVNDAVVHRENLKEGIAENFKQIMEAAKAEEQVKKEYDETKIPVASVTPPEGSAQTGAYDMLQGVLDEWEETRKQTAKTFQEAEEKRLQEAKIKAIQEAEDTMEQLVGIIPEEEIVRLRLKLRNTEKMTASQASKLVAEMTAMLQQEIDALNEAQQKQEQVSQQPQSEEEVEETISEKRSVLEEEMIPERVTQQSCLEEGVESEEKADIEEENVSEDEFEETDEFEEEVPEEEYFGEPEDVFSQEESLESEDLNSQQIAEQQEEETRIEKIPSIKIPNMQLKIEVPKPMFEPANSADAVENATLNSMEEKELQRAEKELKEELKAADIQAEEKELQRVEEELQEELEAADEEILEEPTQRMPDLSGILHKMRNSFQAVKEKVRDDDIYEPDTLETQAEIAEEFATTEPQEAEKEKEDRMEVYEHAKSVDAKNLAERQRDLENQIEIDEREEDSGEMIRLPQEIRRIFSYFVPVTGMEQQLCRTLQGMMENRQKSSSSRAGNVLIQGIHGSGKTVLSADLIKAMHKISGEEKRPIGKIDAEVLNQKDVAHILQKVCGGYLIIENAGNLAKQTAIQLSLLMEGDTKGMVIILEDTRAGIRTALEQDAGFSAKFTERIDIPYFTSDELVTFGRSYAKDMGYRIDEMGVLALYNRISSIQKRDQATTLTEVKEIVDEAIEQSEKGSLKKIFGMFSNRKSENDEYLPLREKDFESEE